MSRTVMDRQRERERDVARREEAGGGWRSMTVEVSAGLARREVRAGVWLEPFSGESSWSVLTAPVPRSPLLGLGAINVWLEIAHPLRRPSSLQCQSRETKEDTVQHGIYVLSMARVRARGP